MHPGCIVGRGLKHQNSLGVLKNAFVRLVQFERSRVMVSHVVFLSMVCC